MAPPLDPSGAEGRSWLAHELLDPAYHDSDPVGEFLDWLSRIWRSGLGRAADAGPLTVAAALVVLLALAVAAVLLLGRARRDRRLPAPPVVLEGEPVTAAELRSRAEQAMREQRHGDAAVDAFRALAVRQHERGRLDLTPGATAHEIAGLLADLFPSQRRVIEDGARVFDEVHYGSHPAGPEQAAALLALDDALAHA